MPSIINHVHHVFSNPFFSYSGPILKTGSNCVFMMKDGSSYEGQFTAGEITGKGVRRFPNGHIYTGDFVNGEFTGYGEYLGDEERYVGQFANNMRHGEGELHSKVGVYVKGRFIKHKLNGCCIFELEYKPSNISQFVITLNDNIILEKAELTIQYTNGEEEKVKEAISSPHFPLVQNIVQQVLSKRVS
jgi:hypothetical protein